MKAYVARIFLCLLTCALAGGLAAARTIEFETTEVTAADVALSPDGQWLIFTMLGHLFRLPVAGGTAEQLTFGPYYDTDPVFSPDGTRVAFVSDRDGSDGNVFLLELATGQLTQVTHEPSAGRPAWAPDGHAITYLRLVSRGVHCPTGEAVVRRVSFGGEDPETLSGPPRVVRSLFYLPDGRLAWTVIDWGRPVSESRTRIEVMSVQGTVSTLRTLEGLADRVIPSHTGDGFYGRLRRFLPHYGRNQHLEDLLFVPLSEAAPRHIFVLSAPGCWYDDPQLAVSADNKSVYLGEAGRLWKITLPGGAHEPIPFRAQVKLEIHDPVAPPRWAPAAAGSSAPPRSVVHPRLPPDGRTLVFGAAGYLWQQPLDSALRLRSGQARDKPLEGGQAPLRPGFGGQAQRLFEGSAFESWPAFSPDGKLLAFVHSEQGNQEVRVFNFESRQTRTLVSGARYRHLSWTSDGQRLVFAEHDYEYGPSRVVAVNLNDGSHEKLTDAAGPRSPRPHFSGDGEWLYFSSNNTGTRTLYRLPIKGKAEPQAVIPLTRPLIDALISPNGNWLAFRRNTEIWVAPLGEGPVKDEDVRQLSAEGGDTFAFTPDASAVVYSVGNRVWRHPLAGGPSTLARDGERKSNHEREEIPIRLELPRTTPPPVLVRRVRVLNLDAGRFGPETSLFIEQGRIRWIGSERGRRLPRETVTVDAGGRFAIPGLFNLHVHGEEAPQDVFLAYGITSLRDVGGWLAWMNALADRGETTSDPVPRYFFAGEIFQGAQPTTTESRVRIYNVDDARAYARRYKEGGAQFIKTHPSLPGPVHRAVVEEARRLGLPVAGHGITLDEVTRNVTWGYASLEHMNPFAYYDDVLQLLAAAGTRWVPTLTVGAGDAVLLREEPERLADAKLRAFTPERQIRSYWLFHNAYDKRSLRGYWFELLAAIRAAHRRGVILQLGTDAPFGPFFGASLHWEMELFAQAGLAPLEVLRIATQEAAAAVGAEDDLGTLEPGKLADLVLLDANPLEDIKNTQTIWRVIKGGWLFDPDKLRPLKSASAKK
jgi:imidazolonepropionase-like amidohydrolase/Tol biopolymer transport system component